MVLKLIGNSKSTKYTVESTTGKLFEVTHNVSLIIHHNTHFLIVKKPIIQSLGTGFCSLVLLSSTAYTFCTRKPCGLRIASTLRTQVALKPNFDANSRMLVLGFLFTVLITRLATGSFWKVLLRPILGFLSTVNVSLYLLITSATIDLGYFSFPVINLKDLLDFWRYLVIITFRLSASFVILSGKTSTIWKILHTV